MELAFPNKSSDLFQTGLLQSQDLEEPKAWTYEERWDLLDSFIPKHEAGENDCQVQARNHEETVNSLNNIVSVTEDSWLEMDLGIAPSNELLMHVSEYVQAFKFLSTAADSNASTWINLNEQGLDTIFGEWRSMPKEFKTESEPKTLSECQEIISNMSEIREPDLEGRYTNLDHALGKGIAFQDQDKSLLVQNATRFEHACQRYETMMSMFQTICMDTHGLVPAVIANPIGLGPASARILQYKQTWEAASYQIENMELLLNQMEAAAASLDNASQKYRDDQLHQKVDQLRQTLSILLAYQSMLPAAGT